MKFTGTERFNYSFLQRGELSKFSQSTGEEFKLFTLYSCKPVIEVITGRECVPWSLYINCVMRIFQAWHTAVSSLRNTESQSLHAQNEKGKKNVIWYHCQSFN